MNAPSSEITATPAARPAILPWYTCYCVFMALMYMLLLGAGVVIINLDPATVVELGELAPEDAPANYVGEGMLVAAMGLLLFTPFAIAPFLPRRPWVWVYGIVLIGLGTTSLCFIPVCLPLLIFWIKPETQRYFHRGLRDVQEFV